MDDILVVGVYSMFMTTNHLSTIVAVGGIREMDDEWHYRISCTYGLRAHSIY